MIFKRYKEIVLVVIVLMAVLFIRLSVLSLTDDFSGVSAGKVLQAELVLKNQLDKGEWYSSVHPPGHLLFLILGLKLYNNELLTPRIISLIFGTLLVIPFYYYCREVFNPRVALFSIFGLAFYSEHIAYSIIATSETSFHFFLWMGFLLFVLFTRREKRYLLYCSGISIGLASMCRYEGLIFIPVLSFFLQKKNKKDASLFLITSLVLPLLWMVVNYTYSQDALQFLHTNDFTVPMQFDWIRAQGVKIDFIHKLLYWPGSLMRTLGWPVFFFGICGVIFCLIKKKSIFPVYIFLILFIAFIVRTVNERLYLQPRYGITLGLMLIPFSVFLFFEMTALIKKRGVNIFVLLLIGSMIPPIEQVIIEEPLHAPYFAKAVANFINKNVSANENIIIDHCGDEKFREPIKLFSRINPRQFVLCPYTVVEGGRWVVDPKMFFDVLDSYNIRILIYSPDGELAPILALEKEKELSLRDRFRFELKYESGPYLVYRVTKVIKDE